MVLVRCLLWQALNLNAACHAVLAWLVAHRHDVGLPDLSLDTGAYVKARQRLPEHVLPDLASRVAHDLCSQATPQHRWRGRRVLAADGSSFSMADTPKNQAQYPQPASQAPGCGFPLAGFVALVCLATGALVAATLGPQAAHDLTLFYFLRPHFRPNDIFLGDRGFCSYAEMALFQARGVDSVLRLHQGRRADFRRGRALAVGDHVVSWQRPGDRPGGLRPEDYARLPKTLWVREVRHQVTAKGFRTRSVTPATTLLEAGTYSAAALAEPYFRRWGIEVDFRHLKTTMRMEVLRGKSPGVVEKEFWAHVLAYNATRRLMWEAGERCGEAALRLSLKGALDHVVSRWCVSVGGGRRNDYVALLEHIGAEWLVERPNRVEPRVRKRRPKHYPLMQEPRADLKRKMTG